MTRWAYGTGSVVLTGLTATAAEWQVNYTSGGVQYGQIRYSFSGSPNLSGVLPGHVLSVSGMANALNNGTFQIIAVNDALDTITIRTTTRLDNGADETTASGSATVIDSGALVQRPSDAKMALGFIPGEKPPAQWMNYLIREAFDDSQKVVAAAYNFQTTVDYLDLLEKINEFEKKLKKISVYRQKIHVNGVSVPANSNIQLYFELSIHGVGVNIDDIVHAVPPDNYTGGFLVIGQPVWRALNTVFINIINPTASAVTTPGGEWIFTIWRIV